MSRFIALSAVLLASSASTASGADLLLNNGLAPPEPANVLSAPAPDTGSDWFHLRNAGCGTLADPTAACPSPGASTTLEIVDGGIVSQLRILDSSTLVVSGGLSDGTGGLVSVSDLQAQDDARVFMTGGGIDTISLAGRAAFEYTGGYCCTDSMHLSEHATALLSGAGMPYSTSVSDHASLVITGGGQGESLRLFGDATATVDGSFYSASANGRSELTLHAGGTPYLTSRDAARIHVLGGRYGDATAEDGAEIDFYGGTLNDAISLGQSVLRFIGSDFELDGSPISLGELSAMSGVLTGTLSNGDALQTYVYRDIDASILLVPEPATGALVLLGLALISRRHA